MNDNFSCPCCKRKLPFRYTLSMYIAKGEPFPCPHCEAIIVSEKIAIPPNIAFPLGATIGFIFISLFYISGNRSVSTYISYAIILFLATIFTACIYTYHKTTFREF